jgi:hypothetical protein
MQTYISAIFKFVVLWEAIKMSRERFTRLEGRERLLENKFKIACICSDRTGIV